MSAASIPHGHIVLAPLSSILITGGAGFIGCRLAERLVGQGHDVMILDSLHPQVHAVGRPRHLPQAATLLTGDVANEDCWNAVLVLCSPEVVVHLAAETGTGQSLTAATRHGLVNVVGTTQMLDAFRRCEWLPSHLVLTSSRAVYGEGRWLAEDGTAFYPAGRSHEQLAEARWDPVSVPGAAARPLPSEAGTTDPRPTSIYAATKLAQEHMCSAWAAATGMRLSTLRLQNVYGPGQSLTNPYSGVVTLFARLALEGRALEVYEDGSIVRDFVHVDDAVDALLAAIGSPPVSSRVLDIGSGTPTTIADVAACIADLAGAPAPVISGRFRDGDVRAASCIIEEAGKELSYSPSRTLEEGIRELLAWVSESSLSHPT